MAKNVADLKSCYGCTVCAVSCAFNAIDIVLNDDGFYRPKIDDEKCVDCGLCLKACSFNNKDTIKFNTSDYKRGYATYSKDEKTRLQTTSGGTTYEIVKNLISKGYKAIVVKYNIEKGYPEHYIATNVDELCDSRGSKYLQSTFSKLVHIIDLTQKYVVVGTPCQIDSLRRYVRIKSAEKNFVFIDFFCHGVPSRLMWTKYLENVSKVVGQIRGVNFRSKHFGWQNGLTTHIVGSRGELYSKANDGNIFYDFFLGHHCLQSACYDNCRFKMYSSSADIRVGDMWGQTFSSNEKGITGVLTFSELGESVLNNTDSISIEAFAPEIVAEGQMKKNARRSAAYSVVRRLLRTSLSLRTIKTLISPIVFFETLQRKMLYYSKRLPSKIRRI